MNKGKKLGVLLGILAAVCVITFAVSRYEEKKEDIRVSGETVLSIAPDTVTAISWETDSGALSFHREEMWKYDGDEEFPVDEDKINERLALFESFNAAFTIENADDISLYGLDAPECTINISTDDKEYTITLGDYSKMDAQRYVSFGDGNVYLAASDPTDMFSAELSRMIKNDTTPDVTKVDSISFYGSQRYDIGYDENGDSICADDVYFADGKPLDTAKVKSYLRTVSSLSLGNYATYTATEDNLDFYGLDEPTLSLNLHYTDDDGAQQSFTLGIGQNQSELEIAQKNKEEDESDVQAYARVGDSRIIYELDSNSFQALCKAGYDDLRHSELFTGDFDAVTGLEFTLDGESYAFELIEVDDGKLLSSPELIWQFNGAEIDIDSIEDALASLSADSFTTEVDAGKLELGIKILMDSETHPQLDIRLYRRDGQNCTAVIDGDVTALVARADVVDMIEAVNAIILGSGVE